MMLSVLVVELNIHLFAEFNNNVHIFFVVVTTQMANLGLVKKYPIQIALN